MKHWDVLNTNSQNEALINEFKGNLFEYLVGQKLSQASNIESDFIHSFGGELKNLLGSYELWLRKNDPVCLRELPSLAAQTCSELSSKLPSKINKIRVVGKSAGGSHNEVVGEADIILEGPENITPISLKLCKKGAFVNTKSAGIRSFFHKYFSPTFGNIATEKQNHLDDFLDQSFERMGHELYQSCGLEFKGKFDSDWTLGELPGQLEPEMREIIWKHYQRVIKEIYNSVLEFFNTNEDTLKKSLKLLLGFGEENLIQAICFHKEVSLGGKKSRYQFSELKIHKEEDFFGNNSIIKINELKAGISSFEIVLNNFVLQIRVKPMNKFTVPAMKINCSLKSLK